MQNKSIFLFLKRNICCGYSKEPSQWDGSFEHPKHMLKLMGKKILTILHSKKLFIREPSKIVWLPEVCVCACVQCPTNSSRSLVRHLGQILKYHPTEWRSPGLNLGPRVHGEIRWVRLIKKMIHYTDAAPWLQSNPMTLIAATSISSWITFANSLDPDLDSNLLILWWYSWNIFRKSWFEKI